MQLPGSPYSSLNHIELPHFVILLGHRMPLGVVPNVHPLDRKVLMTMPGFVYAVAFLSILHRVLAAGCIGFFPSETF